MIKSFVLILFLSTTVSTLSAASYSERPEVQEFMHRIAQEYGFDPQQLERWMESVEQQTSVLEAIQRPAEKKKEWFEYRAIFVTPSRTKGGVEFWRENRTALEEASAQYGVPVEIIVAIIGVETFYGKHVGRYPVLDSLVTLGFDYPKRSAFFLRELEQFLLLSREQGFVPTEIKGSYAGAMGKGQFISSSYRNYAVDFDQDGNIDLWSDLDAIGSVANYFKRHGWRSGEAVIESVRIDRDKLGEILVNQRKPDIPLDTVRTLIPGYGDGQSADQLYSLLQLNGDQGEEYWLGQHNFYVITQYNHSVMYALAVYQLAQAIKDGISG